MRRPTKLEQASAVVVCITVSFKLWNNTNKFKKKKYLNIHTKVGITKMFVLLNFIKNVL